MQIAIHCLFQSMCLLSRSASVAGTPTALNLAVNSGMEEVTPASWPTGWEPLVVGGIPAEFTVDGGMVHSGARSLRIAAAENTRSYICCNAIPVAPGEMLRVKAWVRMQDVPADKGDVAINALFLGDPHPLPGLKRVAKADRGTGWQSVEGLVRVPAQATAMQLQLGFVYASGTLWWDDVTVQPDHPLVARVALADDRLLPVTTTVSVVLLNREHRKGAAQVRLRLGSRTFERPVKLTGESSQSVEVPIEVVERGARVLRLELLSGDGKDTLFSPAAMKVKVPPPLVLCPLSPTHWAVEDGDPQLEGEVEVAATPAAFATGRVSVYVVDEHGQRRASWSKPLRDLPPTGIARFKLATSALPLGRYRAVAEVIGDGESPITSEQPWPVISRRLARVTLGRDGFLARDDRKVFPLGMFNNGARLEESATAGFNIIHAYNAARIAPGQRPGDQRLKDLLDRAESNGMHCLLLVPMQLAITGDWNGFRRRVRMFRNHPALLAWDEEESIARGHMEPETLRRIRRILQEEDPHHPLMVGDSREVITRVTDRSRFFPVDSMDLGMWWWYPFPLKPREEDALQGEQAGGGLALEPPTFLTQMTTGQPLWVGVQAYKKPWPGARYPKPAEYRVQAYLAIIHGAKGLMWYGGSVQGGIYLAPEEGHWEDLKDLLRELRELSPLFMAPTDEPPTLSPPTAPISFAVKRLPDRRVLLAANRGPTSCEVSFVVPGLSTQRVNVHNEDRTLSPAAGRLNDRFGPYAVHIYELPITSDWIGTPPP